MQIDGHHTATYVAARIAGFAPDEAGKIAYAAQYVDDATNEGIVRFANSDYMYSRIASAHRMLDYKNLDDMSNHLAWIPFHFLPGNGGLPMGQSPAGSDAVKLICTEDSPVARDMLRYAFLDHANSRSLHRLGIAMHVYADTFVHQGFVGTLSVLNKVKELTSGDSALDKRILNNTKLEVASTILSGGKATFVECGQVVKELCTKFARPAKAAEDFLKNAPLGHAMADVFPDQPYLNWRYISSTGSAVQCDNPKRFLDAMEMMVKAMRAWRAGDGQMQLAAQNGLDPKDRSVANNLFRQQHSVDGDERRKGWVSAIENGLFTFGAEVPPKYIAKGVGSWKEAALGTTAEKDEKDEKFPYSDTFLKSDWKLFHDALQVHRSDVVHEILPKYGICAA